MVRARLHGPGVASECRRDGALRRVVAGDGADDGVVERSVGQGALLGQEVVVLAEHRARRVEHALLEPTGEVRHARGRIRGYQIAVAGCAADDRVYVERRLRVVDAPEARCGAEVERGEWQVVRGATPQGLGAFEERRHHRQRRATHDEPHGRTAVSRSIDVSLQLRGQFG